ncbi:MAG TPA: signal peptide peptidase SppA, partial [Bacteroidia bacterium]|nr:signal peptide peptidase SppA [Bacteroidia bacterium]
MKQFFGSLLGAIVGVVISSIIVVFIVIGVISSAFNDESKTKVKENTVLHIRLDGPIIEREPKSEFAKLTGLSDDRKMGLDAIIESIEKAKADKNIKGIFLESQNVEAGMASVEEIRLALIDFKKSGKFVYAYGEAFSQKGYYLASVADQLYLNPQGGLDFKGLGAQIMFFKKMLEKLDINVQIFRHGKFKSAVEPFDLEKMSEANRLQTMTYINALWNHMLVGISAERGVDINTLNELATNLSIRDAEDAVTSKLADKTLYYDQVLEELKKKTGQDKKDKLELVTLDKYAEANEAGDDEEKVPSRNKIAVIYAVGSIESGKGDDETIGSDRIAAAIREAREDSSVKAVVLRVNSPGGSALASDVIWREVVLTKEAKPVIVSMGDVAASGGYYIACGADVIVAEPNTITGSIGVFGLIPDAGTLMNERFGITIDTVNTNKNAGIGSVYRPVNPLEAEVIQQGVE